MFRWTWRANSPFNCSRRFSFCRNLNLPYFIVVGARFSLPADKHRSLRRRSETWKYPLGQSETIGNQNSRFRQFMSDRSTSKCRTMLRPSSMHHLSLSRCSSSCINTSRADSIVPPKYCSAFHTIWRLTCGVLAAYLLKCIQANHCSVAPTKSVIASRRSPTSSMCLVRSNDENCRSPRHSANEYSRTRNENETILRSSTRQYLGATKEQREKGNPPRDYRADHVILLAISSSIVRLVHVNYMIYLEWMWVVRVAVELVKPIIPSQIMWNSKNWFSKCSNMILSGVSCHSIPYNRASSNAPMTRQPIMRHRVQIIWTAMPIRLWRPHRISTRIVRLTLTRVSQTASLRRSLRSVRSWRLLTSQFCAYRPAAAARKRSRTKVDVYD